MGYHRRHCYSGSVVFPHSKSVVPLGYYQPTVNSTTGGTLIFLYGLLPLKGRSFPIRMKKGTCVPRSLTLATSLHFSPFFRSLFRGMGHASLCLLCPALRPGRRQAPIPLGTDIGAGNQGSLADPPFSAHRLKLNTPTAKVSDNDTRQRQ
jgi:hypothetical protein